MAQSIEYWWGTGVTQTQGKEPERQRGKLALQGVFADSCENTWAQTWLCTRNWNMSLWTGHTTPLSVLTCMSPQLCPFFVGHHTQSISWFSEASLHPPASHTRSYQGNESHLLGSLLSTGTRSHLQCWCTRRRGAGKLQYPCHIHLHLEENEEQTNYIGNPGINEHTRKK